MLSLVPEDRADSATPPPAAALFTVKPVADVAVEVSIFKAGFTWPFWPTSKASVLVPCTSTPVDVPLLTSTIAPTPLDCKVRDSSVAGLVTVKDTPLPEAADASVRPVAALLAEALMSNVGLVVPLGPTTKAFALDEVIVSAPVPSVPVTDRVPPTVRLAAD